MLTEFPIFRPLAEHEEGGVLVLAPFRSYPDGVIMGGRRLWLRVVVVLRNRVKANIGDQRTALSIVSFRLYLDCVMMEGSW